MEISKEKVSEVIDFVVNRFNQFDFTIEEIGVVEFRPVKHLQTFRLID